MCGPLEFSSQADCYDLVSSSVVPDSALHLTYVDRHNNPITPLSNL